MERVRKRGEDDRWKGELELKGEGIQRRKHERLRREQVVLK